MPYQPRACEQRSWELQLTLPRLSKQRPPPSPAAATSCRASSARGGGGGQEARLPRARRVARPGRGLRADQDGGARRGGARTRYSRGAGDGPPRQPRSSRQRLRFRSERRRAVHRHRVLAGRQRERCRRGRPGRDEERARDRKGCRTRPSVRARAERRSPRPEAWQRLVDRRRGREDWRLRVGGLARRVTAHAARDDDRHGCLHAAGAGAGARGNTTGGPVLAGRDALRVGDWPTAVRWR